MTSAYHYNDNSGVIIVSTKMDISMLTMLTCIMLTCETSKSKVQIYNFDNLSLNQNDCGTPL